jgi:hypothetical protein
MGFIFFLFEFAFVVLPLGGVILSNKVSLTPGVKYVKYIIVFIFLHNILYTLGYSVKGDYFDYLIFTIELPFITLCLILWRDFKSNIYSIIANVVGYLLAFAGIIIGVFGALLFMVICKEYVCDTKYNFNSNNNNYETRRYSFGFATMESTKYTFYTYRTFKYLPFEHLIDRTELFDNKVDFNIAGDLQFDMRAKDGTDTLIIKSQGIEAFKKKVN